MTTIGELEQAYDYFNTHLHDDRLPSRYGDRRTELSFGDIGQKNLAQCSKTTYGWSIVFNTTIANRDISFILIRLEHEMGHADCWRVVDHDEVYRDFMFSQGLEINERGWLIRVVPGGSFERVRDAFLAQRHQTPTYMHAPSLPVYGGAHVAEASSDTVTIGTAVFVVFICTALTFAVMSAFGGKGGHLKSRNDGYNSSYGRIGGDRQIRWQSYQGEEE